MKSVKLAVIGGDGIGPDVVAEGLKVLYVSEQEFYFYLLKLYILLHRLLHYC